MSRFSGKQHKGAKHKTLKALKRKQAKERNAATPEHRRRAFRKQAQVDFVREVLSTPLP